MARSILCLVSDIVIPDKPAFKAAEVCEIAGIQPYVLRSWESEFPDLGLSKTPGGPRVYRRADVERVLRIRAMVFDEGLTLAGVRRRFEAEQPDPTDDLFSLVAEMQAAPAAAAPPAPPPTPVRRRAGDTTPLPLSAEPPSVPAPEPVPAETRERIGKLKADLHALLDMLGGPLESPTSDGPRRRTRRSPA